jgi:hypothetical protein
MPENIDENIIVEPKQIKAILLVINSNSCVRILEQVGGDLLAKVLREHLASKPQDVGLERGVLIDPVGTDVYRVSSEYINGISALLDIDIAILKEIRNDDIVKLIITL